MRTVRLGNIIIGEGMPKVFVPIVGRSPGDVIAMGKRLAQAPLDGMEWRADFCPAGENEMLSILAELRRAIGDLPLIFTFRTADEGGMTYMDRERYAALNRAVASSGLGDGIDIETEWNGANALIAQIQATGCPVIGSRHIAGETPCREEMAHILRGIQAAGPDICKLAVYAHSGADAMALLSASDDFRRLYANRPFITMAMGEKGIITRIAGEIFGSAITFASVGEGSASGQIPLPQMNALLRAVHEAI